MELVSLFQRSRDLVTNCPRSIKHVKWNTISDYSVLIKYCSLRVDHQNKVSEFSLSLLQFPRQIQDNIKMPLCSIISFPQLYRQQYTHSVKATTWKSPDNRRSTVHRYSTILNNNSQHNTRAKSHQVTLFSLYIDNYWTIIAEGGL